MRPKLRNCQNLRRKQGIFVIVCGIRRGEALIRSEFQDSTTGIKNRQILPKNKACIMYCYSLSFEPVQGAHMYIDYIDDKISRVMPVGKTCHIAAEGSTV